MKHDDDKIERAVEAALASPRVEEAARQCGMSRTTFWRITQQPEFKFRLNETRMRLSRLIVDSLQANALLAVGTLRAIMQDQQAPVSARVSAAGRLLDLSLRAKEQLEMTERVAALEATLNQR